MSTPHAPPDPGAALRRRVLRNTASNYAGKLVMLAASFLLTPFVLRHLGPAGYGLWAVVGSMVAYGSLLDLGIASAVVKYVAHHHARGDDGAARTVIGTALALYTGLGLVAVALGAALAPLVPHLFHVSPGQEVLASRITLLTAVGVGLSIPGATPRAVLAGLQRFDVLNLVSVAGTACTVVLTVLVLGLGGGVLGLVAVNIAVTLVTQGLSVRSVRRLAPGLRFSLRDMRRDLVREVASFSSAVFATQVAGRVQTKTDEIVIASFLPVTAVTPYAIARKLSEVPQILTDQFMKLLLPLASTLSAAGDRARLREVYLTGTRLTLALCLPVSCTLLVLARPILAAWIGDDYAGAAPLVVILTTALLLDTLLWPTGAVMQGMGRHRPIAAMAGGAAALNLALSIILAPRLGVTGVALGTLVPMTLSVVALDGPYAMRVLGVGVGEMLRRVVWGPVAAGAAMGATLYLLRRTFEPTAPLELFAVAGAGFVVYVGAYLTFGAGEVERRLLRDALRRVR